MMKQLETHWRPAKKNPEKLPTLFMDGPLSIICSKISEAVSI